MSIEEHATPLTLDEFPQLAALEILDAAIAVTVRALAAAHPDMAIDGGVRLSDDDPPLPWIAADLLDQTTAIQNTLHRYHRVALEGGSSCHHCAVRQRTIGHPSPKAAREMREEEDEAQA